MKDYSFLVIIVTLHIAQCLIPGLVVKKLDKTLIARKRQDTMDMCRLFTEETEKNHHNHAPKIIKSYIPKKTYVNKNTRFKRDAKNDERPEENRPRFKRHVVNEASLKQSQTRFIRDVVNEESPQENRPRSKRHVVNEDNLKENRTRFIRDVINKESFKENRSSLNKDGRGSIKKKRYKRGATMKYAVNPALKPIDARRVENIVDKLYDDLEEKGKRVTYRQAQTTKTVKVNRNQTFQPSRRFDFAPSILVGGQEPLMTPIQEDVGPFDSKARWKFGIVPYFIDFKTYDAHLSEMIVKAFDYVERATCIRLQKLREKPIDKLSLESVPWIYITNPTGIRQCVHSNENRRVDGVLMTVFGYDCMSLGDIIHEVMHILGFSHEHLRSDRDQHITILWENIKPGYKKFFDLNRVGSEYDLESLPYDYSSILHYPPRAFSKNGQITIMTESGVKIGQREGLSEMDVEKIAVIYANECVSRNREYLLQTCPSVVKSVTKPMNITNQDRNDYFKERLWPFGIVNYKLRDKIEFTVEERENIKAVFRHIEQETCIQFRDVSLNDDNIDSDEDPSSSSAAEKANHFDGPVTEVETEHGDEQQHMLSQDYAPGELYTTDDEYTNGEEHIPGEEYTPGKEHKPGYEYTPGKEHKPGYEPSKEQKPGEEHTPGEEYSPDVENAPQQQNTGVPPEEDNQFGIVVGELPEPAQSTEKDFYKINSKDKVPDIIVTDTKKIYRRQGKNPHVVSGRKDIADNEIPKTDESKLNNRALKPELDFKRMNLTMKKSLLVRAKAKRKIANVKRYRRDTTSVPTSSPTPKQGESKRRHANAILVLTRSPEAGCSCPTPGRPKGNHVLEIGAGCFNSVNDLLHFFAHVLGLDHQHNMHDRDNYLHIMWDKLTPDIRQEMERKLPPAASAGFPYDYQSVMHYPWLQIKDGKTNIMYPIWNDGWAMGHWQGLSTVDVQKLNVLYFTQCLERQKQETQ